MTVFAKILRFVDPQTDRLRMDLRLAMSEANAHAEDVSRTVALHGDKIAEMLKSYAEDKRRAVP